MDPVTLGMAKADAKRKFVAQGKAGSSLSRQSVPRTGLAPTFTKSPDNPLFMESETTAGTITWCWPMRVDGYLDSPRDVWYMWFSTDHSSGAGGIWLAHAPHPDGPYTQVGQVYAGEVGSQTETPSVVWDESISKFRMIMHRKSAGLPGAIADQVSVAATSADGETNWSPLTIVLDDTTNAWPGGDHYGDLRPFWANGRLAAYHVIGGGENSHFGLSYSDTFGATWTTDPRPLGYGAESIPDPAQRVDWLQCSVVDWRGQPWYVGAMRPPTAGGVVVQSTWIAAPLSPDLRRFAAKAIDITPPAQAWENTVLGSPLAVVSDEGRMYLFYRGGGGHGGFGVAVSEVAS